MTLTGGLIDMKFHQAYLKEQLSDYLKSDQPVVIFTSEQEQPFLEKLLLTLCDNQAFFHVQVTSMKRYILNQLKKHDQFRVQPLTKALGLYAVKESLKVEGLNYFANLKADAGLLEALYQAYESMAEIDLEKEVSMQGISQQKWQDLKKMFKCFKEVKGTSLLDAELYLLGIHYIDSKVRYVNFSHTPYRRSQALFLEACRAISLDEADLEPDDDWQVALDRFYHQPQVQKIEGFPVSLYEVQFKHQEIDLVLQEIETHLKAGARYQDLIVYVPDKAFLEEFVRSCRFPCRYECSEIKQRNLAFLDHLWTDMDKIEDLRYLAKMDEDTFQQWLLQFKNANTSQRVSLLSMIVEESLLEEVKVLPEDLSLEDFILLAPILIAPQGLVKSEAADRIELTTYEDPILSKSFQEVFMCGLNEDVYPSKISDKGLILNEELAYFEENGTSLDHQNDYEWEMVKKILVTAPHFTATCHFGSLGGEDCLPSLLFNHLKQLKGILKTPSYPFIKRPMNQDAILERIEATKLQPTALNHNISLPLYKKNGQLQISPSELESFNQCPYKHFLSYGLKLYPKKPQMETRARFGTLMHHLLDDCAKLFSHDFENRLVKMEQSFHLETVENLDERLDRIVTKLLQKEEFVCESQEESYLLAQFKTQFLNTLKMLLYHIQEGQFELSFHELALSKKEEQVTYVGRIDRADLYQDYLKVLDYKSSGKSLDLGLAMQGFNIQMLVYLELLARKKNLQKGAVLYFNTSAKTLAANGKMNLDGTSVDDYVKAYRMEGWIMEDDKHQVMHALDRNYPESKICHIRYVKSKDAYTGQMLKESQWEALLKIIFDLMHQMVDECFYQGDIRIYPAGSKESAMRMKVSPCRFCDYANVCLKDPFYHEEREITAYTKEEITSLLEGGKSE